MPKSKSLNSSSSWEAKKNSNEKLWEFYFEPKEFEMAGDGRIYKNLWVGVYDKIISATAVKLHRRLGADKEANNYFIGKKVNEKSIKRFETGTRVSEVVHGIQIPATLSAAVMYTLNGDLEPAILFVIRTTLNTYAVMQQRYNRTKLYKIFKKRYGQ